MSSDERLKAALKLHDYVSREHWNPRGLVGPDPGIRFNYRIGRYVKSYLRWLPWGDELYYLQAQGYWISANWLLHRTTNKADHRDVAIGGADRILERQRTDGAWDYPNPEWKGRVATVEGIWGSLALLETYRQTGDPVYLNGALRWHAFLERNIGYQKNGHEWAVNYFANRGGLRVPNNSTDALRFLAELADATGEPSYSKPCEGMIAFLTGVQLSTGEIPYAVEGDSGGARRTHFQCFQYNAFQCMGLMDYFQLTGDPTVLPLIGNVLRFLRGGVAEDGHALYACGKKRRQVVYHAAALAAAFHRAAQLDIDGYTDVAKLSYAYLLRKQKPDGRFPYSRYDHGCFSDNRSYPRYLAMILWHLLIGTTARCQPTLSRSQTHDNPEAAQ